MKFRFTSALVVALAVMALGDYAYALDCSATNLTKQEAGICALRKATEAGAKTAPIKQNLDGTCTQDGKTITCPSNSSLIEPSYTRSALMTYCKTHLKSRLCKNAY